MACVSMSKICNEIFISSFGVYREILADVSATEGVLDLPDYIVGIVNDNWSRRYLIWSYSRVHMHDQKRSL
jgi:hypothetical protein